MFLFLFVLLEDMVNSVVHSKVSFGVIGVI